jgi:hypothetical protein
MKKIMNKETFCGLISLFLSIIPWLYGTQPWWPHNVWSRMVSGPIVVVVAAALIGYAAHRSKWWLLVLICPFLGILLLLTASV